MYECEKMVDAEDVDMVEDKVLVIPIVGIHVPGKSGRHHGSGIRSSSATPIALGPFRPCRIMQWEEIYLGPDSQCQRICRWGDRRAVCPSHRYIARVT